MSLNPFQIRALVGTGKRLQMGRQRRVLIPFKSGLWLEHLSTETCYKTVVLIPFKSGLWLEHNGDAE